MACPFFGPLRPMESGPWSQYWTHRPRLPLGEAYSGLCHAHPGDPRAPSEEHQRELCNHGYARGACEHFPNPSKADAVLADAVRFSVAGQEPLRLMYILEKDHAPLVHGVIDPTKPDPALDQLLASQARAFVESYLKLQNS